MLDAVLQNIMGVMQSRVFCCVQSVCKRRLLRKNPSDALRRRADIRNKARQMQLIGGQYLMLNLNPL